MLAAEAILMDESGNWLETSTGNLGVAGWQLVDTSLRRNLTRSCAITTGKLA